MKFVIEIASVPDREDLVAEIWWGDAMVAELSRDANGDTTIEIFSSEPYATWQFDLTSWLAALEEGRRRMS